MPLHLHASDSATTLDAELAEWVASRLKEGVARRGMATLVVSGGRTPLGFFRQLRGIPLEWGKVTVTLSDERWVPNDHADSNERLVREHLLRDAASAAAFVPLKFDAETPAHGARLASAALAPHHEAFDVVILGMGEDGHTASIFPDSPQVLAGLHDASNAACIATENATKAPRWRISMTAPRLLNAHNIVVHISGAAKWALLGEALAGTETERLPIRFALQQERTPCHVFWCR
ncbi:6-phosphogluconolactonase [Niveibacterium umoris]|uniref:6-phosphogluconolactonase n=1 Tax=Niveibacterium umoris TaxID=1193620 RepID=A0A840BDQ3_9RHOO|nr:6-phosphogluconolactonase [Niveibacterium umoris]MBB4011160.1 6-phosphogluconolactonase [Niveibacterium umoris]